MPGRVLNFLEFSDKYSGGEGNEFSLDDMKNASSNFEEGFDDDTYDLPEISANRPVSGNYEVTPQSTDSTFSEENSDEMNAPSEELEDDDFATQQVSDSGEDEDEEEDLEDEEEDLEDEGSEEEDDDELEEGNPEAGANPKKKVEESVTLVKGFRQFVNESDYSEYYDDVATYTDSESDDYPEEDYSDDEYSGDYGMYPEDDEECCSSCGEVPIENEYGYSCGCNM